MKRILSYIAIVLCIPIFLQADVRYVSKTGTSTPPYMSWEAAADSIQKCLDICDNGDTIYVGNGVYHDSLVVNKSVTMIGMSMDSTIIDGAGYETTINVPSNLTFLKIRNFKILGKGYSAGVGVFCSGLLDISYCFISNAQEAIFHQGGTVNTVFILNTQTGIGGGCPADTCHYKIENNLVIQNVNHSNGISCRMGGYYIVRNNIFIFYDIGNSDTGIKSTFGIHRFEGTNNIISGYQDGIDISAADTVFLFNNIVSNSYLAFALTNKAVVKNNISINNGVGFVNGSTEGKPVTDYNLFWSNIRNYHLRLIPGDSDIIAYPMFENDTKPDPTLSFDFHLQKYSPAIDKGDPSILDADGTRSDIGVYGGPYGESYTYNDLAPLQPKNLTAVVDSGKVLLKWKKNPEADTSYYSIYMDSTQNFTIDSTKLLDKTSDTLFTFNSLQLNKPYYFKVTATDKQGNRSVPSEELLVTITSAENDEPKAISTYQLYNNYPNPFNPSTKISYKLKERGYVKLLVYDIKGEVVKVLVNKEQEAGYYETLFDASGLSSSIYLYKLEVTGIGNIPAYTEMKKCVLIK